MPQLAGNLPPRPRVQPEWEPTPVAFDDGRAIPAVMPGERCPADRLVSRAGLGQPACGLAAMHAMHRLGDSLGRGALQSPAASSRSWIVVRPAAIAATANAVDAPP